jgi:hypothetical protein
MEWREVCRCLSRVTTLSAHIVLQEFERILVEGASGGTQQKKRRSRYEVIAKANRLFTASVTSTGGLFNNSHGHFLRWFHCIIQLSKPLCSKQYASNTDLWSVRPFANVI